MMGGRVLPSRDGSTAFFLLHQQHRPKKRNHSEDHFFTSLRVRYKNSTEMPILPGAANIFVGADLIGSASLEFVAPRETASLYLGVDESVKITRRLDEKNSGLTFLSKRKQLSFAYSIQARNFRAEAVQLAIYESLPVSQDERISIDLDKPVPKPDANDRGMMRWDLTLEPGKERTAAFSYRIEYPGDLVTEQLQQMEQGALRK